MRISAKDISDCKQIGVEMSVRRTSVKAAADRRRFVAWLIRQCRAGATPNDYSIGRWCDMWEQSALKVAA
jgi:hypothetical protein